MKQDIKNNQYQSIILIEIEWSKKLSSTLKINLLKKQITCSSKKNGSHKQVETNLSFKLCELVNIWIQKGFSSMEINKRILKNTILSTDLKQFKQRENQLVGGGGCGSKSYMQLNEQTVAKKDLSKAQIRKQKNNQSITKADVQQLNQDMENLIKTDDNDIYNGKAFILDQIFPHINKFGVIANRVLHKNLLKLLMKSMNIILKVGVQQSSSYAPQSKEQDQNDPDVESGEDLIWTDKDKKQIDEVLNNILDRIKSRQNSEHLLNQVYCLTMIRDMLRLHQSTYKVMDEALKYGVPLFGLIRNQDPTLLLQLAVKAVELYDLQVTRNQTQQMIQYQINVMQNIRKLPDSLAKESKNVQLLFAYHITLDDIFNKKKNINWEVQYFSVLQINELMKTMIDTEEDVQIGKNDYWQQFFKDEEKGIFTICKVKFSMSGIFLTDLVDSYLLNHRMLRSIALEIVIHSYKLILQQEKKSSQKNISDSNKKFKTEIINLIYQRWLIETNQQVRTLFLDEDVLIGVNELIQLKNNENQEKIEQVNNQFTDEDKQFVEYARKEKQAIQQIQQQRKNKATQECSEDEKQLEKDLQNINDTLECLNSEDGIKKVIKIRQIELWKQSILNRRAKGEIQKDDSLLEQINLYVNQRLQQKQLNSDEEEIQEISKEVDALNFLKNEFIQEKNQQNQKKNNDMKQYPLMCIAANGGMGKSMLLKKIEMDLLEDFSKDPNQIVYDVIPIIVKMVDLDPDEPNLIQYLQDQPIFKEQRLDAEVLKKSGQKKLLLLDAFDEYKGKPFNLWSKLNLSEWQNTQIIVTCREESLSKEDYNQYFSVSIQGEQNRIQNNNQSFLLSKLIKFGKEQLLEFAQKQFESNKENKNQKEILLQFQKIIEENDQIMRLISLPINAFIFIKTLPQLLINNQNISIKNQTQLYEIFFNYQFERESLMLPQASTDQTLCGLYKRSFFILFQNLAIDMFQKGSLSTDMLQIPFVLLPELKKQLKSQQQKEIIQIFKQYRNPQIICSAMEDFQDSDQIKFVHKSLFEYFVAKAMIYEIDVVSNNYSSLFEVPFEQLEKFAINSRYIMERGDSRGGGISILQQLARMIKTEVISLDFQKKCENEESLKENHRYIQLILLSRRQYHGEKIDIAASNMLSAIAYLKPSLNKLKLTRISAKKAYLYNYRGKIDFTGSNLREAMLNECFADYSRCRTDLAQINDAQSLWTSEGIYSFTSCLIPESQKNPKFLDIITGSNGGYVNEFQVNFDVQFQKDKEENYILSEKKSYELKKSKRLYRGRIIDIKQFENKYIVAQQNNIIILDQNLDEIQIFQAHNEDIESIDINYQSKHLASVCKDRTIKVWNMSKSFVLISSFDEAHLEPITNVRFSQSLGYLVSSSIDRSCKVWKLQGNEYVLNYKIDCSDQVQCIALTPDGKHLFTLLNFKKQHQLWKIDQDKAELVKEITILSQFNKGITYSPNGKYLIIYSSSYRIIICDVQNEYKRIDSLKYHTKWIIFACFSSNSDYIVSTSGDNSCAVWDVNQNFKPVSAIYGHVEEIMTLSYSLDAQFIISSSQGYFYIWRVNNSVEGNINYDLLSINILPSEYYIRQMAFSNKILSDKYQFAIQTKGEHFFIYEFKLVNNKNIEVNLIKKQQSEDQTQLPVSLQYSSNDQLLLTSYAKSCTIWDLTNDYQIMRNFDADKNTGIISACLISDIKKDFHLVAIAQNNNIIHIWDISERNQIQKYKSLTIKASLLQIKCSPSGKYLVTANQDKTCQVWDVSMDFTLITTLSGIKDSIINLRFSYDDSNLACTSKDKSIYIWSTASNFELIKTITTTNEAIDKVDNIAFNPTNSKMLLSSFDFNLVIWDLEKAFEIDIDISGHSSCVSAVCFSFDGTYLLTAGRDSLLKLWYCSTFSNPNYIPNYELLHTVNLISTKKYQIKNIIFCKDNKHFITNCSDGNIRVQKISQQQIINVIALQQPNQETNGISLYPQSNDYLAIANYEGCTIYFTNYNQNQKFENIQVFKQFSDDQYKQLRSVEFSKNQNYLATGTYKGSIILWDSSQNNGNQPTFNQLHKIQDDKNPYYMEHLKFTPDSQFLIVGYFHRLCKIIHVESRSVIQEISNFGDMVTGLDVSSDGSILSISTFNDQFMIYKKNQNQSEEKKEIFEFNQKITDHTNKIFSINFCKEGNYLATGSLDKTCRIWSVQQMDNNIQIKNIQNI